MWINKSSRVAGYGYPLLFVGAALALRLIAWPWLHDESPFLFFIIAIALSAWRGGFYPGILATGLTILAVALFLLKPHDGTALDYARVLQLTVAGVVGLATSSLISRLQAAHSELEERVNQRTAELARTNRELDAERNKLLVVFSSMPEAVYIVNQENELQFTNPAFEKEFGPVLPGERCYEQLHGRPERCSWCRSAIVFAGTSSKWEWECARNGRIYDVFEASVFNADESLSKVKIMHDVTEHKKAQANLAKSENLLRKTLETLPVGVWITDKDGNVQLGNSCASEIWGDVRLVGVEDYQEYVGWHVETGKRVRSEEWAMARALATGETFLNEEVEIQTFDGARKIILNSAAPVRDETGAIIAGIAVNQDVTEQKLAEREQARQHKQLKSLWGLSRKDDLDLDSLLDHVLKEMLVITESRYGFVGSPNEDGTVLDIQSWSAEVFRDCTIGGRPVKCPIAAAELFAKVFRTLAPVIVNEYKPDHPDASGFPGGHLRLDRVMIVPVVSNGRVVTIAALANREKAYTPEDAEQIAAFLTSANTIVARKKAEEALRRSEGELRRLSSELLTAQESERLRISRELHDDLGQSLTLVKLRLGLVAMGLPPEFGTLLEHCSQAGASVDQAIDSMRRLSRDLCPSVLEDLGLSPALTRLASETAKASRIQIRADLDDIGPLFPTRESIILFRIFQETLTNIVKHSGATEVDISARIQNGLVAFEIRDNGKGMRAADAGTAESDRGLGLSFMKERIRTLGGSMELWSQKGMGTRVSFTVPIPEKRGES